MQDALVTTEELKEQLWPKRQVVGESSLTNAVAQVRKTLADTGQVQQYIQTVHRRGYRFVAPVTARPPEVMPPLAPDPPASPSASRPVPPLVPLAEAPSPATPSTATGAGRPTTGGGR